jgi:SAM-dependent methyltransferase
VQPSITHCNPLLRALASASDTLDLGLAHGFESGPVLDRIYANAPGGRGAFGQLLDAQVLALPPCESLRARKTLVLAALRRVLNEVGASRHHPTVLDLGCGAGRYVIEALKQMPRARAVCVDLDGLALRTGAALANASGATHVTFERSDALDIPALSRAYLPDIVIVSGLFEHLSDENMRRMLAQIRTCFAPARLIFTTQPGNLPRAGLWAPLLRGMDSQRRRPVATIEAWTRGAGFSDIRIQHTPDGVHAVWQVG